MNLWVKKLSIEHFRGINRLSLDLTPDIPIVLIGVNGVGKSSILDFLEVLLSLFVDILIYAIKKQKKLIQYIPESGRHGLEFDDFVSEPLRSIGFRTRDIHNQESYVRGSVDVVMGHQVASWNLSKTRNAPKDRLNADLTSLIQGVNHLAEVNFLLDNNFPTLLHYTVKRAVTDVSLDIIDEHSAYGYLKDHFSNLSLTVEAGFSQFFKWFRSLEDLENEERRDNSAYRDRQLEAVRQAIASLLPGFSNLRVRRSPLRMTISKDNEDLVITQLSDGEKCLMAMVGDIARRLAIANPDREDPLEGSGIILIDEIELHLHPDWQRRVIPSLTQTFPNCQFIVTTHSPQVVSHVKPEGIYLLEKQGEEITAHHPESSFGRDTNRILEDLMGVPERPKEIKENLMELFRLIDQGNLEQARQVRQALVQTIGTDEPAFAKADVMIRRKEILNG